MVVKITAPHSLERSLCYHEQKVKKGVAECLEAVHFLKTASEMSFQEKHRFLQNRMDLNTRAQTKALHLSLNFAPGETLEPVLLKQIARDYMEGIGFGAQPYLLYQHRDAGHPHLHILTTTIQENGKRIDTFAIGKRHSEPVRKRLEQLFGLQPAQGPIKRTLPDWRQKVERQAYGMQPTRETLSKILNHVLQFYQFTTFSQYVAVLKTFGVSVGIGTEGSRQRLHKGLTYQLCNKEGLPMGVPLKASRLWGKPTYAHVEKKIENSSGKRAHLFPILKSLIDWAQYKKPTDLEIFQALLASEKVEVLIAVASTGQAFGLTFIDHRTGLVCKGSDLGKSYSLSGLQVQWNRSTRPHDIPVEKRSVPLATTSSSLPPSSTPLQEAVSLRAPSQEKVLSGPSIADLLLQREDGVVEAPAFFHKKKRKKKRQH